MPQWLDSDSTSSRSNNKKNRNKNRGTYELRHHDGMNTQVSNEAYMQINLQDLEAYTNSIVEAEQQRRRRIIAKGLCGLTFLVFVAVGAVGRFSNPGASVDSKKNSTLDEEIYEYVWKPRPLTTCEKTLMHNSSFHDLLQALGNNTAPASTHCRPEFPDCDWVNPTLPEPRKSNNPKVLEGWQAAFEANQAAIQAIADAEVDTDLDVVLVGDSLVEHMEGKELGTKKSSLRRDEDVFETLFTRQGGGSIDGLALGIAGDRCSNLLHRLQNGELTYSFGPKIWWIIMGTRDWELGVAPVSIVAGIVSIVELIRKIHPEASVVINSLLPHDQGAESIRAVNQMLGCYVHAQSLIDEDIMREQATLHARQQNKTGDDAEHHHKRLLHFFNATNIFVEQKEDGSGYKVNPAYIASGKDQDPDAHGEWLWGKKIVQTVHQLIRKNNLRRLGESTAAKYQVEEEEEYEQQPPQGTKEQYPLLQ